eukprot:scaffold3290_cov165-Ochromonas_danica.AAC.65
MSESSPSEEILTKNVHDILASCDPSSISMKQLRSLLEDQLGCDLYHKKDFLRGVVEEYLFQHNEEHEEPEEKEEVKPSNKPSPDKAEPPPKKRNNDKMPRTEVMKEIWNHIKAHNLQNPKDRREIICDHKLEALFKRKSVHMFKMNKILSTMMKSIEFLTPQHDESEEDDEEDEEEELNDEDSEGRTAANKLFAVRNNKRKRTDGGDKVASAKAKPKKSAKSEGTTKTRNSELSPSLNALLWKSLMSFDMRLSTAGFQQEVLLSDSLAAFLGCESCKRTEVTKRVWNYIKEHNLQNPQDRREILCDEALQKVLKCSRIHMFKMTKLMKVEEMVKGEDSGEDEGSQDEEAEGDANGEGKDDKGSAVPCSSSDANEHSNLRSSKRKRKNDCDKDVSEKAKSKKKLKKGAVHQRVVLSKSLADIFGCESCKRTDLLKLAWDYIKEHDLQNPNDRREILCDAALAKALKCKRISMWDLTKTLSKLVTVEEVVKEEIEENEEKMPDNEVYDNSDEEEALETKKRKRSSDGDEQQQTKRPSGLHELHDLPPDLAEFMETSAASRAQIVSALWKHIKENDLQNPDNRRQIICDETFEKLFKCKEIHMMELAKGISTLLGQVKPPPRKIRGQHEPKRLDAELAALVGTDVASRCEVTSALWKYIREHNLQDPADKREVICDETLANIVKCDRTTIFGMVKLSNLMMKDLEEHELKRLAERSEAQAQHLAVNLRKHGKLDAALAEFMGKDYATRKEVVKAVTSHITENNLIKKKKTTIKCDETLIKIFNKPRLRLDKLNRAIYKHMTMIKAKKSMTVEEYKANLARRRKTESEIPEAIERKRKARVAAAKRRKQKKMQSERYSNSLRQDNAVKWNLDEPLAKFMGKLHATREEVLENVAKHALENQLVVYKKGKRIKCDEVLSSVFNKKSIRVDRLKSCIRKLTNKRPVDLLSYYFCDDDSEDERPKKRTQRKVSEAVAEIAKDPKDSSPMDNSSKVQVQESQKPTERMEVQEQVVLALPSRVQTAPADEAEGNNGATTTPAEAGVDETADPNSPEVVVKKRRKRKGIVLLPNQELIRSKVYRFDGEKIRWKLKKTIKDNKPRTVPRSSILSKISNLFTL